MASGQEAALGAIRGCFEARDVEFAESQQFDVLKWKIIEGTMAMANLRDGGFLIVGMSQRGGHFDLQGIRDKDLATYDPDVLIEAVNKYAKPPVEAAIYTVEEIGKKFLVIDVEPFSRTPVMCSKPAPGDSGRKFKAGDIFARSADRASTTRVAEYSLMEEIIEIAAEKRAADIISAAQRIGLRMPTQNREAFARERSEFGDMGEGI